jgi:hypothetical protein
MYCVQEKRAKCCRFWPEALGGHGLSAISERSSSIPAGCPMCNHRIPGAHEWGSCVLCQASCGVGTHSPCDDIRTGTIADDGGNRSLPPVPEIQCHSLSVIMTEQGSGTEGTDHEQLSTQWSACLCGTPGHVILMPTCSPASVAALERDIKVVRSDVVLADAPVPGGISV